MAKEREPDKDETGGMEKLESIVDSGVNLRKGIAMDGLGSAGKVEKASASMPAGKKAPKSGY